MYEVEERTLTDQPTMVVRAKVKLEDISAFLGRVYHTVDTQIRESGVHVVGPPFARYRPLDSEYREFEIEAGLPVLVAVPGKGDVVASSLAGGPVAVTVHTGPYERMEPAYEALAGWMRAHGVHPAGPAWEVYFTEPDTEPDPATWRTEIAQPYVEDG